MSPKSTLHLCFLSLAALHSYGAQLCVSVDDDSRLPLANAWVNVTALLPPDGGVTGSHHGSTDSKGKACISLPEGMYSVEVGLIGFLNVRYYPVRVTYPSVSQLSFRLPIGDVREGGVAPEAVLSGTLLYENKPVQDAKVCILQKTDAAAVACEVTNEFGEYALSVPPGDYNTVVRTTQGAVYKSTISVPHSGTYRNRLAFGGTAAQ